jgi:hypothetical protein
LAGGTFGKVWIMSAIGLPHGKEFTVSAYANYTHDHLVFARMQSLQMREMEWEGRIRPLTSWSALIGRAAAVTVLAGAVLAFVF